MRTGEDVTLLEWSGPDIMKNGRIVGKARERVYGVEWIGMLCTDLEMGISICRTRGGRRALDAYDELEEGVCTEDCGGRGVSVCKHGSHG